MSTNAKYLGNFYHAVRNTASNITMREVVKWIRRCHMLNLSFRQAGWSLLSSRFAPGSHELSQLRDAFNAAFPGTNTQSLGSTTTITNEKDRHGHVTGVVFQDGRISVHLKGANLENSRLFRNGGELFIPMSVQRVFSYYALSTARPPEAFMQCLARVAVAAACREPVLLVGGTGCKSTIVQTWAELTGNSDKLVTSFLTPDTETPDLIGQMQPYTMLNALDQIVRFSDCALERFQLMASTSFNALTEADRAVSAQEAMRTIQEARDAVQRCVW